MSAGAPAALALDLGTTRVKLGLADAGGALLEVRTRPAPRPAGSGLVRTLDADRYRRAAEELLADAPEGLPLGIASQRSSFLLWDRRGRPATPLVSWQDRSAEAWCERAAEAGGARELARRTGLVLSPHYAGPKLAALFAQRPELARRAAAGELLFGTLETYLVWHWGAGAHETDLSMAARTLLVELGARDWSPELTARFGVPPAMLGRVLASSGRATELAGAAGRRLLTASLADQPAGLVASLGTAPGGALVNLGTGVFCLVPTGAEPQRRAGYLTGPLLALPARARASDGELALPGAARHALEGTVNGGGATADRQAPGPTEPTARDPAPEGFCLPDENGLGAPYWRAAQPFVLEPGGGEGPAAPADRRRLVLEGLVFRAAAILEELAPRGLERVLVSGGLANEPFVPLALAAALGRPVEVLEEQESTLAGAARLALGLPPDTPPAPRTRVVAPPAPRERGAWLATKSRRWRAWLEELLAQRP